MIHIVITPFFNEELYISNYINSIINQTKRPELLIMVDDSSTDNTPEIVKNFSQSNDWIKYFRKESMPKKVQGSKVIEAFNYGFSKIDSVKTDFISKIDADLELPENYFELVLDEMVKDRNIAISGGRIMEPAISGWKVIPQSDFQIRGALKTYNARFFEKTGGLKPVLGWDGLDMMEAFYYGWKTKIVESNVKHYRPANDDYKKYKINFKYGIANYKNGGSLFLATIRSVVRLGQKPFLVSGISFFSGYIWALLSREQKNVSPELAKFINSFHRSRLFSMKRF